MAVSGYLEILTCLLSWHLYASIWNILTGTGIALIPFATILLGNLVSAQSKGNIQGSAGIYALKKTEVDIYIALAVIIAACQPLVVISINDVIYTKYACDGTTSARVAESNKVGSTKTKYDGVETATVLNGEEIRVPVWWSFTNNLFRGITAEAVQKIPCSLDMAGVVLATDSMRISDPKLRQEALDFAQECWIPASNKYRRENPIPDSPRISPKYKNIPKLAAKDTAWPGSLIFNSLPGYYRSMQSKIPVERFPYDAARDSGRQSAAFATSGFPSCSAWWPKLEADLSSSIVAEAGAAKAAGDGTIDKSLKALEKANFGGNGFDIMPGYTTETLHAYYMIAGDSVQSKAQILSNNFSDNTNPYSQSLVEGAARVGMLKEGISHYPAMRLARDGAPMLQALILMLLVIVLPFIMVFSQYSIGTVITVTFMQFGLIFWSFLFALAYWLDNHLAEIMFKEATLFGDSGDASTERSVMSYISATFHIALPLLFGGLMSWAGVKIGDGTGSFASSAISGSNGVTAAGRSGGQLAAQAPAAIATKGKSLASK